MHFFDRVLLLSAVAMLATSATSSAQCLDWDDRFSLTGVNGGVYASAVFDDGTGPALYIAGDFTVAGGAEALNFAKWNGSSWSAWGSGAAYAVNALAVFDDGNGPALYAGGAFTTVGGVAGQ